MAFYDLKCTKCGKEFNQMASMAQKEQKLIKCPECGSNELESVFKNLNVGRKPASEANACPNAHICGCNCNH